MTPFKKTDFSDLKSFYNEIREFQEKEFGAGYCLHHDFIAEHISGGIYKELGTHQGASLAGALLAVPQKVVSIDIKPELVVPYKRHMLSFAAENNIDLQFQTSNSIDPKTTSECDILLIDSKHTYDHCFKELKLHSPFVSKYIVIHDTNHSKRGSVLRKAMNDFLRKNTLWKLYKTEKTSVGFSVLQRI